MHTFVVVMHYSRSPRQKRHARVRAIVRGTSLRPRLSVYRSHQWMEAQLIDDEHHHTLCAASERARDAGINIPEGLEIPQETKRRRAWLLGWTIAQKAAACGITTAVFDRGGYIYHGRVKALADGARLGGLLF